MREYICTQCRQCIVDVSGWPGGDVCSTCVHIPNWHSDPKLREIFMFEPYAEGCLRAFAQEIFKDWPDYGAIEGWDLQEIALRHGLLKPVEVTEPCGENCACAEYGDEFPMTCYKRSAVLTGKEP